MKINQSSAWSYQEISEYLQQAKTPLRLSCLGSDGYPTICSLWFIFQDDHFWCASHRNAHIIKLLKQSSKVGFEVATNEYPYKGVRGKADIELLKDKSGDVLESLIKRYLGESNKELSDWLLSRREDEYAIKISPKCINSWDFSNRMTP